MGRKGDALRAAKMARVTRTFTEEQLRLHDQQVKREAILMYQQELKRHTREQYNELNDRIRVEWEQRAKEFASDDLNNNFMNAVAYMFAIPCRVLIEQFGWKPVRYANCPQTRTEKLAVAMIEELNRITENEKKDIRTYARETFDKYGLKFVNDFVFNEGEAHDEVQNTVKE